MTDLQWDVYWCSDGTLSYLCGSTNVHIIEAYRQNVMAYAEQHPELANWQAVCKAYNLQLQPEPKKEMA